MEYMELQRILLPVTASGVLSGYKGTTFLVYTPHFLAVLKLQSPPLCSESVCPELEAQVRHECKRALLLCFLVFFMIFCLIFSFILVHKSNTGFLHIHRGSHQPASALRPTVWLSTELTFPP